MGIAFASGKHAIAICDRCGFRYKLKELKPLVIKTKHVNLMVCPECWEPDQPQLQVGMRPVNDPQALRNPRTDTSYQQGGTGTDGEPTMGSRVIQWGWNPVGGPRDGVTPNTLVGEAGVGQVTVETQVTT